MSRASAASLAVRAVRLAAALALPMLAACGSDDDAPASTVSAGPGCELSYALTGSPLLTGADPLLPLQWHLRNTGQTGGTAGEDLRAPEAWTVTRGAGVRVAVVDDAVEVVHADLVPNLVADASYSYRAGNRGSVWPLPCTAATDPQGGGPVDGHGTAVAGIVLGRDDNALGIVGVAPRASLVAFDALSSGQDVDIADALLRDHARNAIYQNSWGSPDDGSLHRAPASFLQAIRSGIASGRGGRGSVFVFPAGNGGCYARDTSQACQSDDSNFDGFVNGPGVIAVCSVDDTGRHPFYGEPGANVLVCAPSSGDAPNVTTTSIRGAWRYDFSGTSASTPMVSGVVALMLSVNPELTWRDVRLILAHTARRNDPFDPGWVVSPDGLAHNHKYGFGVVDAAAAVARATRWSSVGGSDRLKRCTLPERAPGLPVPDAGSDGSTAPVSDALVVPADCDISQIEFVEVTMTATHTYSGDLRVRLRSPAGLVSELARARICGGTGSDPCGAYTDWTFGSARHLGEPAAGTWTLEVTDMTPIDVGRLERWSLRIHGR